MTLGPPRVRYTKVHKNQNAWIENIDKRSVLSTCTARPTPAVEYLFRITGVRYALHRKEKKNSSLPSQNLHPNASEKSEIRMQEAIYSAVPYGCVPYAGRRTHSDLRKLAYVHVIVELLTFKAIGSAHELRDESVRVNPIEKVQHIRR